MTFEHKYMSLKMLNSNCAYMLDCLHLKKNPGRIWMVLEAKGSRWKSNFQHHSLQESALRTSKDKSPCTQFKCGFPPLKVAPSEQLSAPEFNSSLGGVGNAQECNQRWDLCPQPDTVSGIWSRRNCRWISQAALPQLPFLHSSIKASQLPLFLLTLLAST